MPPLVSLYLIPSKQGLPLNLGFTNLTSLVSQQAPGFICLSCFLHWDCMWISPRLAPYLDSRGLRSGPHVWTSSIILTEPSPCPPSFFPSRSRLVHITLILLSPPLPPEKMKLIQTAWTLSPKSRRLGHHHLPAPSFVPENCTCYITPPTASQMGLILCHCSGYLWPTLLLFASILETGSTSAMRVRLNGTPNTSI